MSDDFEYSGPTIQWTLAGDDETQQEENLDQVEESFGFDHAQQLVADTVARLAPTTVLDFTSRMVQQRAQVDGIWHKLPPICLLYTSPSPRDQRGSRMPSSA